MLKGCVMSYIMYKLNQSFSHFLGISLFEFKNFDWVRSVIFNKGCIGIQSESLNGFWVGRICKEKMGEKNCEGVMKHFFPFFWKLLNFAMTETIIHRREWWVGFMAIVYPTSFLIRITMLKRYLGKTEKFLISRGYN